MNAPDRMDPWSRRDFLRRTGSCAAHLALLAAATPLGARRLRAAQERYPVVAREPWGRIQRVAEGVWALVSTPLEDRTTLCNGGIVAGRSAVVVVEGFASDAGARWMMERARELTGREPTHLVATHYHGDHTAGLGGAVGAGSPEILVTPRTRELVLERNEEAPAAALEGATLLEGPRPTEIDLGGRSLLVVPRRGHTDSDLTLEVTEPRIVFCGDLVWNGMFPNYVDAIPSRLSREIGLMRALEAEVWVPGHGALADAGAMERYAALLDDVEAAARTAVERGWTAEEAGAAYELPAGLEEWVLFSPAYFQRAIGAWMEELRGGA